MEHEFMLPVRVVEVTDEDEDDKDDPVPPAPAATDDGTPILTNVKRTDEHSR